MTNNESSFGSRYSSSSSSYHRHWYLGELAASPVHASRPLMYPLCPCQLVSAFGYLSGCIELYNSSTPFHEAWPWHPLFSAGILSPCCSSAEVYRFSDAGHFLVYFLFPPPLFGTLCCRAPFVVPNTVPRPLSPVRPLLPPPHLWFGGPAGDLPVSDPLLPPPPIFGL